MQFTKFINIKLLLVLAFAFFSMLPIQAEENTSEIDILRAELSFIKDKNSPQYVKTKQKLEKLISKNKITYTNEARFADTQRLIYEQKYNSAIWELNELIENGYQPSKCNEFLADISQKLEKPAKKSAQYYKIALQYDNQNSSARFKLAKLYLQEGKNILAIENFRQVVVDTKNDSMLFEIENIIKNKFTPKNRYEANNLYEILGNIYIKINENEKAYEAYAKALQTNREDLFLKYYFANLLYENNQNENAIALYNSILETYPNDMQIKNSIAKLLLRSGDDIGASNQYEEILAIYPNSPQAKYGLYKTYENKLPIEKILKKIYLNNPNFVANSQNIQEFAVFLADMGDVISAQNLEKCAQLYKEQEKQKLALLEQQKQAQITNNAQNATAKKESKPEIQNKKQESLKQIEQTSKTKITQQQKASKKQLQQQENLKKQEELIKQKKLKEEQLLKEQKAKQDALEKEKIKQAKLKKEQQEKEYQKKQIEFERKKAISKDAKKYQKLKTVLDKYIATTPKTTEIHLAIANTYKQMGEVTNSLLQLKEAMKADPTNSEIYFNLGLTHFEMNNLKEAKINLTKSINLDSENSKAKNLLAFVNQRIVTQIINEAYEKYEKKQYVPAFETLEKGIEQYPKNAQLYYYRALVYSEMNRNAAAIYDFEKSIELDPSYYMAYYHLGKTYEKIKDERNALVAYEKFLSIEPEEQDLIKEIEQKVVVFGAKYY